MQKAVNVVILAAGKGTRMNSDRPKVLHELAGKPLLGHVLDAARALSPSRICVVYGHGGETVKTALSAPDLAWVDQTPQLGTGHAMQLALPELEADAAALVLYGDVPLIGHETLQTLCALAGGDRLALLTAELADPTGYGRIVRDAAGGVRAIVEHKDADEEQRAIHEINTGMLVAPVQALSRWLAQLRNDNAQGEYYLTDIVGMAVAEGTQVTSCRPQHDCEILGVNTKAQLAELERLYQRNRAEALLAQGTTLIDPARFDVRGELICGRDVTIDVNCVFEGRVVLGNGVRVGANCVLRDVEVAAGTRIAPFSLLEEASLGEACRIGPFARVRPGTRLGRDVHVGNFVEIKNSAIADASKVNHLAYVGDSDVGRDVNIGAGTITCNYDGAYKHRTVIEDDVFVGSDTQFVAPVTIGRGATIGAGSTITKDVPPGDLALTRAKQTHIPGWKRPRKKT